MDEFELRKLLKMKNYVLLIFCWIFFLSNAMARENNIIPCWNVTPSACQTIHDDQMVYGLIDSSFSWSYIQSKYPDATSYSQYHMSPHGGKYTILKYSLPGASISYLTKENKRNPIVAVATGKFINDNRTILEELREFLSVREVNLNENEFLTISTLEASPLINVYFSDHGVYEIKLCSYLD